MSEDNFVNEKETAEKVVSMGVSLIPNVCLLITSNIQP